MPDSLACPGAVWSASGDNQFEQLNSTIETIETGNQDNEEGTKYLQCCNLKQTGLASIKNEE